MLAAVRPRAYPAAMRTNPLVVALLLLAPALAQTEPVTPKTAEVAVGKAAPTFRANDHQGKMVQVGRASKRWTVLAFYPKAATPG